MHRRIKWLTCLVAAGWFLLPAAVWAQEVGSPSWEAPLPLMLDRRESGFYFAAEPIYFRLNNSLHNQVVARRGFFDEAGQLRGTGDIVDLVDSTGGGRLLNHFFVNHGPSGAFYGSGERALKTGEIGNENFEPGLRLTFGYRMRNDIAVEFVYWRLTETRHGASAGIMPRDFNVGQDLSTAYISSFYHNYPLIFGGPDRDVVSNVLPVPLVSGQNTVPTPANLPPAFPQGSFVLDDAALRADISNYGGRPLPAFGIWNAAEDMRIELIQRVWNAELNFRVPVFQTESTRCYALVGPRHINIYERFQHRTVDADIDSVQLAENTAVYSNQWENRLYGGQLGFGNEVYLGSGFALSVETRAGVFADVRNTNVKMELGTGDIAVQRSQNDTSVAPMFQIGAYIWWYPLEGVQVRAGYEFLGIFNTQRAAHPIDFNVGRLEPDYDDMFMRLDGWTVGVAFIF